jgi:hypothetical protein
MLSQGFTVRPQEKQCDAGRTTDSPRGTRAMHTLKKLPRSVPNTPAVISRAGELSQDGSPTVQRYHLMLDFAFP